MAVDRTSLRLAFNDNQNAGVSMPVDPGNGNFGDVIHGERSGNDYRAFTELFINDEIFGEDQPLTLYYDHVFDNPITSVRAINLGRERAYVQAIELGEPNGDVKIDFYLRAQHQVRLLIEIYVSND